MNDLSVIDRFTTVFGQYIDSGFGLLRSEVGFLTTILIGIDVVLAGLFWLLEGEENIIARFARKILYVGFFAYIINNFSSLTQIIFNSFAGLGLKATGSGLSIAHFLQPGQIAIVGVNAAQPILDYVGTKMGITSVFANLALIVILLVAWFITVASFFILAVQLFIAIIEFKLTTLCGFVLVPFALWKGTAFLAERVLGNIISSGIKILVLAVIVGIGSTIFGQFTTPTQGIVPGINTAPTLILASLALLGLGIFGPGIAGGLVTGAPQLGAGAAIGTTAGAVGLGVGVAALASGGVGAVASLGGGSIRAAAAMAGGARGLYGAGTAAAAGKTGLSTAAAGAGGAARAGGGAVISGLRSAVSAVTRPARQAFAAGERAIGGTSDPSPGDDNGSAGSNGGGAPPWARRLQTRQRLHAGLSAAHQAIRQGDHRGAGANPDLSERQP